MLLSKAGQTKDEPSYAMQPAVGSQFWCCLDLAVWKDEEFPGKVHYKNSVTDVIKEVCRLKNPGVVVATIEQI